MEHFRSTTILSIRKENKVVIGGDGQVSLGNTIFKGNAQKVRKLYNKSILAGFAGSSADAFTLFELFETHLEQNHGRLEKSAVELTREWRTNRSLSRLEAMLIVADVSKTLVLSGNGDVMSIDDGIVSIGSGGDYARSAAKALYENTSMSPKEIVEKSLNIAADVCIYTNHNLVFEELEIDKNA